MRSVEVAHNALCSRLLDRTIFDLKEEDQDKTLEIRYSRNKEFIDEVAKEFLERNLNLQTEDFVYPVLKDPFFG
jgi:hypothetical protein